MISRPRRLLAEFVGTLFLSAIVIGSGISAERLSPGDVGLELLENSLATTLGLFALISVFAPISGAHFNPVVSLLEAALGRRSWKDAVAYIPAQVGGCTAGAAIANLMFGNPAISVSTHDRLSPGHFLGEMMATTGLVLVIFLLARNGRERAIPAAVAAYIGAAYFFTSSTSFANPAITIGRIFSDSFAGIAPASAPGFVAAQLVGAGVGLLVVRILGPAPDPAAP